MRMISMAALLVVLGLSSSVMAQNTGKLSFPIVDSGVLKAYSDTVEISLPKPDQAFYGQDANYSTHPAAYTKNGDGTVTDNVTGLTWEADMGQKMTLEEARSKAAASRLGGKSDWRVPSLKEVYSLINFSGRVMGPTAGTMFIDTRYFNQPLGDASKGEREIDAQTWSSTAYVGKIMRGDDAIFGVNFVDGRIKGYPKVSPRTREPNRMYFRLVRGNTKYGINQFVDNHDGTVSDLATGLMWQQADSGRGMDWKAALAYSESLSLAGHDDWRMPSAKELQSIVDYTRAPRATQSAALDPVFSISMITDPRGEKSYPFFWTGTTLLDGPRPGNQAIYQTFGEALGKMQDKLMDAHGAGATRSDPKSGIISEFPKYFGPQGDVQYLNNYARSVRVIQ